EDARVHIRNIRREGNEELKAQEKGGKITEDDCRRGEAEVQKLTDEFIKKVDEMVSHKEKEIMEI
ncbi:MAG: ribosome-recycling factor, partial [bacterium]|nr:ribosome-recycling factor [bacterium]